MIKKISILVFALLAGLVSTVSAEANKQLLCHKTNSGTSPFVLISVSENAVPAQLEQGGSFPIMLEDGSYVCEDTEQPPQEL